MYRHPLLLTAISIDVLGVLLVAAAAVSAIRVLTAGSPESAGPGRAAPFSTTGTASVAGRAGFALLSLSTLLLVFGIAGVLPKLLPGVMCGEGVLQTTQGEMGRALTVRGLALGTLALWHLLDRLNRSRPDSPLATQAARTLLLASPIVLLAVYGTFLALLHMDADGPTSCCKAIYGKVGATGPSAGSWSIPEAAWTWGMILGALTIGFAGLYFWRTARSTGTRSAGLFALATILWIPVGTNALLQSLSVYHFGIPRHPCPWCLFLPANKWVGYVLFGSLILAGVEAGTVFVGSIIASRIPALTPTAEKRARLAGLRTALAAILFLALAVIPAIVWRIQHGMWME